MAIDRAEVEIVPELDVRKFSREIESKINRAMRDLEQTVDKTTQGIEKEFDEAGSNVSSSLSNIRGDFTDPAAAADRASDEIEGAFAEAASDANAELEGITGDFSDVEGDAVAAGDEVEGAFDAAADEATSALAGVTGDFGDAIGEADGASDEIGAAFEGAADAAGSALGGVTGEFGDAIGGADGASEEILAAFESAADASTSALSGVHGDFSDAVASADAAADEINAAFASTEDAMVGAADTGGAAFVGLNVPIKTIATGLAAIGIGGIFKGAALSAQDLNSALARTDQIIQQTQGAAGFVTEEIRALSKELGLEIGVDTVEVQNAANILLTFKEISGETFETALGLAGDMADVFGTDLRSGSVQLGKALNDPVKGISALSRVGVQFTDQQKEQIEAMVEAGDVMGAQGLILAELEGQVGGTAAAAADSTARIGVAMEELRRSLGGAIIEAVDNLAPALIEVIGSLEPVFSSLGEAVGQVLTALVPVLEVLGPVFAEALRNLIPAIEPLGTALLSIVEALSPLLPLFTQLLGTLLPPFAEVLTIVATALAPLITLVADFAGEILNLLAPLLRPLVDVILRVATVLSGGLMAALSAIIPAMLQLLMAMLPIIPALIEILEALIPLIPPLLRIATTIIPLLIEVMTLLVPPIVAVVNVLAQLIVKVLEFVAKVLNSVAGFVENWRRHWTTVRQFFTSVWNSVRNFIVDTWNRIREFITGAVTTVRDTVVSVFTITRDRAVDRFRSLRDGVINIFNRIRDFIGDRVTAVKNRLVNGFNTAKDGVLSVFRTMRKTIGNIWDGLTGVIKAPVRTLFRWINSNLIGNANKITGLFGLDIPRISTNFHSGGVVPGQGEQLARVLGGEGWLTPGTTAALGGERGIAELNRMGETGKLAQGGPLDWVEDNILDPAGRALGAIGDQITSWLKQGVGFAMSQLVKPLRGAITSVVPDGFANDFISGIFSELTQAMERWGRDQDAPEGQSGTASSGRSGWALPLPPGSYRIGRGPAGHGYDAWDLPAPTGTPIFSVAAGIVSRALRLSTSYGIHAFVDHFNGFQSRYAHMQRMFVRAGQQVSQGQQLGTVDSTGNSTGPHLHIELLRNGVRVDPRQAIGFDTGIGTIPPGYSLVHNGTGGPETLARMDRVRSTADQLFSGEGGVHFHVNVIDGPLTLKRAQEEARMIQRAIEHTRPVA